MPDGNVEFNNEISNGESKFNVHPGHFSHSAVNLVKLLESLQHELLRMRSDKSFNWTI